MAFGRVRFASPGVIGTVSKLTKSCILRLTPQHLFFVLSGKVTNGGVSMWCELAQVGSSSSDRSPIDHRSINRSIVRWQPPGEAPLAGPLPADLSVSPQANVFDEFQMEGFSPEDNEICLEVPPESLSRALRTTHSARAVKVKLTKKHCPCLTVTAELVSGDIPHRSVVAAVTSRLRRHGCDVTAARVCGADAEERAWFWGEGGNVVIHQTHTG